MITFGELMRPWMTAPQAAFDTAYRDAMVEFKRTEPEVYEDFLDAVECYAEFTTWDAAWTAALKDFEW